MPQIEFKSEEEKERYQLRVVLNWIRDNTNYHEISSDRLIKNTDELVQKLSHLKMSYQDRFLGIEQALKSLYTLKWEKSSMKQKERIYKDCQSEIYSDLSYIINHLPNLHN